jgi:hypothetical protein
MRMNFAVKKQKKEVKNEPNFLSRLVAVILG